MQKKKTPFTNWKQECLLIPVFAETFPTQDMRANEPCKEGYVKRLLLVSIAVVCKKPGLLDRNASKDGNMFW